MTPTRAVCAGITVVLTVSAVFLINFSYHRPKSGEQIRFESWLQDLEQRSLDFLRVHADQRRKRISPASSVEIGLRSSSPTVPFRWTVRGKSAAPGRTQGSSAANKESLPPPPGRVLRLLTLIREANLFSLSASSQPLESEDVELVVQDGMNVFSTAFNPDDFEGNSAATLLVKLIQLYRDADPLSTPSMILSSTQDEKHENKR